MTKSKILKIISVIMCFVVIFSCIQVCATATTQPDAKGDTVKVKFLFAFYRSKPNLSPASIKGLLFLGKEVTVLGYDGDFIHVQLKNNNDGYIHKYLLNDKRLNIVKNYMNIYTGDYKDNYVQFKFDLDDKLEWSLSEKGIVEVTKYNNRSFSLKGLSPGVVELTVKCGKYEYTCDIACIDKWEDTETAKAESEIEIMGTPGKTYAPELKIPQGATIIARGHIPEYSDYVYVSSGDIWGFIKLSDFSGVDYFLTEYHYYDKGYKIRFPNVNNNTPSENIYSYTSVLNDVMMKLFNLKVCSYVNEYTSLADTCKILSYEKVDKNNISKPCPQNGTHKVDSCLERSELRETFKTDVGPGNSTTIKLLWTGHILPNHQASAAQNGSETIIMTTANTVSYNNNTGIYSNTSDYNIRKNSLYTLTHETGHLLGTKDGYCKKDNGNDHCSNENCYSCNKEPVPNCIMVQLFSPEESTVVFCDECTKTIKQHLNDHH